MTIIITKITNISIDDVKIARIEKNVNIYYLFTEVNILEDESHLPIIAVALTLKWNFSKSIKHSRSQFSGTTFFVTLINWSSGQAAIQPGIVNKMGSSVEFL